MCSEFLVGASFIFPSYGVELASGRENEKWSGYSGGSLLLYWDEDVTIKEYIFI